MKLILKREDLERFVEVLSGRSCGTCCESEMKAVPYEEESNRGDKEEFRRYC